MAFVVAGKRSRRPSLIENVVKTFCENAMRIEVADLTRDADYIRHARLETLKAVCVQPRPELVEPLPVARYVLAYDERSDRPIGMGESAMLADVYKDYDDIGVV